jgi:hypothetical protein
MLKSDEKIPPVSRFKYFEIEILENQAGSNIYVGIIENKDNLMTLLKFRRDEWSSNVRLLSNCLEF